ncbi:class I SAM-dependent methyltransferase [Streptomyces sp. NPDC003006]
MSTDPDRWSERHLWEVWADHYDESFLGTPEPDEVVAGLVKLAAGGRALELGIGTGRIAIPLAQAGVAVDGIELSEKMARRVAEKAAGLPLCVITGDMADVPTQETYSLVIAAHSALHLLQSQQDQLRCIRNSARVLTVGGHLAVEHTHPQVFAGKLRGKNLSIRGLSDQHLALSATVVDTAKQTISFQEISFSEDGLSLLPCHVRWVWPSELDLMATMASLELVSRAQDWQGTPVTPDSTQVVSIYCKVEQSDVP